MLWNWYYRFLDWIENEPEGKSYFGWIGACVGIMLLYIVVFSFCFLEDTAEPDIRTVVNSIYDLFVRYGITIPRTEFYKILIGATLVTIVLEEVVFRLPLLWAVRRWDTSRPLFVTLVLISASFGFIHGGFFHILIQGVLGLFLGVLFLKAGGINRNRRKAFGASLAAHLCYDFLLISGALLSS